MGAAIPVAIQAVLALVSAAPQIEGIVSSAKTFFAGLFNAGLISADVQNALHAHVDSIVATFKAVSTIPSEFTVQADPAKASQ